MVDVLEYCVTKVPAQVGQVGQVGKVDILRPGNARIPRLIGLSGTLVAKLVVHVHNMCICVGR